MKTWKWDANHLCWLATHWHWSWSQPQFNQSCFILLPIDGEKLIEFMTFLCFWIHHDKPVAQPQQQWQWQWQWWQQQSLLLLLWGSGQGCTTASAACILLIVAAVVVLSLFVWQILILLSVPEFSSSSASFATTTTTTTNNNNKQDSNEMLPLIMFMKPYFVSPHFPSNNNNNNKLPQLPMEEKEEDSTFPSHQSPKSWLFTCHLYGIHLSFSVSKTMSTFLQSWWQCEGPSPQSCHCWNSFAQVPSSCLEFGFCSR